MRNETRKNQPSQSGKNARKSGTAVRKTPERAYSDHTSQERVRMQAGLRILARIIARAHLSSQASGTGAGPLPPESPQDMGNGD